MSQYADNEYLFTSESVTEVKRRPATLLSILV